MGALHAAARDGQHGKAAELVGKGTDVNQTDGLKYTPLHYAARKGVLQTVELLLKAGARVDPVNTKGQNALYQAVVGGHTAVARMLIEHGSDVNCRTRSGLVPLHFAARSGPAEIVQLLLGGGANMEEKTAEGMTALHIAKQSKQAAIVGLLDDAQGVSSKSVYSVEREIAAIRQAEADGEIDSDTALERELEALEYQPGDGQQAGPAKPRASNEPSPTKSSQVNVKQSAKGHRPSEESLMSVLSMQPAAFVTKSTSAPAPTPAPAPAFRGGFDLTGRGGSGHSFGHSASITSSTASPASRLRPPGLTGAEPTPAAATTKEAAPSTPKLIGMLPVANPSAFASRLPSRRAIALGAELSAADQAPIESKFPDAAPPRKTSPYSLASNVVATAGGTSAGGTRGGGGPDTSGADADNEADAESAAPPLPTRTATVRRTNSGRIVVERGKGGAARPSPGRGGGDDDAYAEVDDDLFMADKQPYWFENAPAVANPNPPGSTGRAVARSAVGRAVVQAGGKKEKKGPGALLGPRMRPPTYIDPPQPPTPGTPGYDNMEHDVQVDYHTSADSHGARHGGSTPTTLPNPTGRPRLSVPASSANTGTDSDGDMLYAPMPGLIIEPALIKFLTDLGLLDRCAQLADDAGVVMPDDFLLFDEGELTATHGFKVGHVRKIYRALNRT